MTRPSSERSSITWNTASSRVVSRPATAITTMQASQPDIQSAALTIAAFIIGGDMAQLLVPNSM